jgi:fatty-acyl-CoA synthase
MTGEPLTPFDSSGQALRRQATLRPDAEALAFPSSGGRRSFASWLAEAESLGRGLLALGLPSGAHVAVLGENRLEWPIAQLGIALAGMVLVPLNSHYGRDDLAYALTQSRSRALLLSHAFRSNPYLEIVEALRPDLPDLAHVICFDGASGTALGSDALHHLGRLAAPALPEVGAEDIAALLYTSGTTGFPKGALLTHGAMLANAFGTSQRLGVAIGDRWTSMIPLFHCAGCILNLLGALQCGATYVGLPSFDPLTLFEVIEQERCTLLSGVPTAYAALLDHPARGRFDLGSLRAGSCGGADADPAVLARCAREFPMPRLAQVYGQTEAATLISCPELEDDDRFATAGRALPGHEICIADPATGESQPPGAIGEIRVRGPMLMRGYYDRPAETAETLDGEGWLHTGDLGYLTPQGRLVVAGGRLRDMIIRGGENIYPVEIENLLRTHESVAEIAVFALPDPYYGEVVGAAVQLQSEASAAALTSFCRGRIARFKIPTRFFRIGDFPMTASGKIRKKVLRDRAVVGSLEPLP